MECALNCFDDETHQEPPVPRLEALALSFISTFLASSSTSSSEKSSILLKKGGTQKCGNSFCSEIFDAAENKKHHIVDDSRILFRPLTYASAERTANLLAILHDIICMQKEGRYTTLRQLYYSNINIARHQRIINNGVAALTQHLQLPRECLHITSTAKCIIRGPIIILEKTCTVNTFFYLISLK